MSCNDGVIPKMSLSAWKTASPHFVIPESLLEESVVRAKREAEDYLIQEESLQMSSGKNLLMISSELALTHRTNANEMRNPTPTTMIPTAARPQRAAAAAPAVGFGYFDPITNLSAWTRTLHSGVSTDRSKSHTHLTLHSLVTPAPLSRRRNAPDTILTTLHPSLRAWLAPLFHPRRATTATETDEDEDEDYEDDEYLEDRQDLSLSQWQPPPPTLNRNNLGQHLEQLLLANYNAEPQHPDNFESRQQEAVDVLQDSARVAHQVADLLTNYEAQTAGQRKFSHPPHSFTRTNTQTAAQTYAFDACPAL